MVVVLAVVGAGWAIDRLFDRFDTREDNTLRLARELGGELALSLDLEADPQNDSTPRESSLPGKLTVLEREAIPFPDELQLKLDAGEALTLESEQGVTLYFDMPRSGRLMSLAIENSQQAATQLRLLLTVLFYGVVVLLILVWLNPLIRRLQQLAIAAQAFGEGDLTRRIPTTPRSNLFDIETEFNRMAQRIEGLMSDNKLLSSAVSHDLRTPLARLRFGIDALSETKDESLRSNYLERISADVTQMEQLVEVLLEFARLDRQLQELPLTATNLNSLVGQCVASFEDTPGARISWDPSVNVSMILANDRYALMLITNIVQNSLTHGNGQVAIALEFGSNTTSLIIEDDGEGIADAERAEVLKPFIRGGSQSKRKKSGNGGYGLGLAIVSRIAQWHDAELSINRSQKLGGARIGIGFRKA